MSYTTILEEIKKLSVQERLALLESISRTLREDLVSSTDPTAKLTASEIRHLPMEERQRILAESARLALADYQSGSKLTEFTEVLAGEDIYEY